MKSVVNITWVIVIILFIAGFIGCQYVITGTAYALDNNPDDIKDMLAY
jgi:hypothetical protein